MTDNKSQVSLDDFYTPEFILKKERFYGKDYSSSGGEAATKDLLLQAGLKPNEKVLDIACGQGGPDMYMARHYGVYVLGLDFSKNLIELGRQRLAACEPIVQQRVQLEHADATTIQLKHNYYDVIYSKESICMISDKKKVYENIMNWIRPDGRLFISDWCKEETLAKAHPIAAGNIWGHMVSTSDNISYIEAAGFKNVKAEDVTHKMISNLENSLRHFKATKEAFIQDFDSDSYLAIENQFSNSVTGMKKGETRIVLFTATASK